MHVSLEHGIIPTCAISLLFQCVLSAPQYFEDEIFNPSHHAQENDALTQKNSDPPSPDYRNSQGNDFISDGWYPVDALPTQDSFWSQQVSDPLPPPAFAESQFSSVISEPGKQFIGTYDEFSNQFQRGRSDIDPEEDEEEFRGYFYPKPKIPFELPVFETVNVAANEQPDATIVTTTAKDEESSPEKTTTTTTPATTTALFAESSTGPIDKV